MRQHEIQIGQFYIAKVGKRIVTVRVMSREERVNGTNGKMRTYWTCQNMLTKRIIQVKSCQRFRGPAFAAKVVKDPVFESAKECPDSPSGKHEFTPDLEYDATGQSINCRHCGKSEPLNPSFSLEILLASKIKPPQPRAEGFHL